MAFLLLTLFNRDLYANTRSELVQLVLVYFLGFSSTHAAVVGVGKITLAFYLNGGFDPSIFAECVYLRASMVVLTVGAALSGIS